MPGRTDVGFCPLLLICFTLSSLAYLWHRQGGSSANIYGMNKGKAVECENGLGNRRVKVFEKVLIKDEVEPEVAQLRLKTRIYVKILRADPLL